MIRFIPKTGPILDEKFFAELVTIAILFSITGYVLLMNSLFPFSGCFVK